MSTEIKIPKGKKVKRTIRPLGEMVLIRHDNAEEMTIGGIILPYESKIHTSTGIILAMPEHMKENEHDYPFKEGDNVMYDMRTRVPYNNDPRDKHFLVEAKYILGVIEEEFVDDNDEPDLGSDDKERLADVN